MDDYRFSYGEMEDARPRRYLIRLHGGGSSLADPYALDQPVFERARDRPAVERPAVVGRAADRAAHPAAGDPGDASAVVVVVGDAASDCLPELSGARPIPASLTPPAAAGLLGGARPPVLQSRLRPQRSSSV